MDESYSDHLWTVFHTKVSPNKTAVVVFGDVIHVLYQSLCSSNFCRSNPIALSLSLPTANVSTPYLETSFHFLFLLFDNFSLQSNHAGHRSALAMEANDSVQELLNSLFPSAIFSVFLLVTMAHDTPARLQQPPVWHHAELKDRAALKSRGLPTPGPGAPEAEPGLEHRDCL